MSVSGIAGEQIQVGDAVSIDPKTGLIILYNRELAAYRASLAVKAKKHIEALLKKSEEEYNKLTYIKR